MARISKLEKQTAMRKAKRHFVYATFGIEWTPAMVRAHVRFAKKFGGKVRQIMPAMAKKFPVLRENPMLVSKFHWMVFNKEIVAQVGYDAIVEEWIKRYKERKSSGRKIQPSKVSGNPLMVKAVIDLAVAEGKMSHNEMLKKLRSRGFLLKSTSPIARIINGNKDVIEKIKKRNAAKQKQKKRKKPSKKRGKVKITKRHKFR